MNAQAEQAQDHGCERLMSRREVAAVLGVTPRTVTNWTRQGVLPAVRLPGRKQALGYLPSAVRGILTEKA